MLPVGLKKMSITSVCTSSSPEMYTGKDLESITFVSRKSGSEKYELTDRKKKRIWSKENWQWYSGPQRSKQ